MDINIHFYPYSENLSLLGLIIGPQGKYLYFCEGLKGSLMSQTLKDLYLQFWFLWFSGAISDDALFS